MRINAVQNYNAVQTNKVNFKGYTEASLRHIESNEFFKGYMQEKFSLEQANELYARLSSMKFNVLDALLDSISNQPVKDIPNTIKYLKKFISNASEAGIDLRDCPVAWGVERWGTYFNRNGYRAAYITYPTLIPCPEGTGEFIKQHETLLPNMSKLVGVKLPHIADSNLGDGKLAIQLLKMPNFEDVITNGINKVFTEEFKKFCLLGKL